MSSKQKCEKCGHNFGSLADGICFFCDQKNWTKHFDKLKGKAGK